MNKHCNATAELKGLIKLKSIKRNKFINYAIDMCLIIWHSE